MTVHNTKKIGLAATCLLLIIGITIGIPLYPLASNKSVNLPFTHTNHDAAYIFFGFKNCSDICPTTLAQLASLKKDAQETDSLGYYFVDIDQQSNLLEAQQYAETFDHTFIGVFPNHRQLDSLSSNFGLNFSQHNEIIKHQGRLYFTVRENGTWYLKRTYNPKRFTSQDYIDNLRSIKDLI